MYEHVCTYTNAHKDVHMGDGTTSGGTLKMLSTSPIGVSLIVHQLGHSSGQQGLGIVLFFHAGNKLHSAAPSLCVWALGIKCGPLQSEFCTDRAFSLPCDLVIHPYHSQDAGSSSARVKTIETDRHLAEIFLSATEGIKSVNFSLSFDFQESRILSN